MNRPPSILLFERLYLAALVVSIVLALANWSGDVAALTVDPGITRLKGADGMLPVIYPILRLLIWAGWLLLWFFVARRGSRVAKIVVTLFVLIAAYDGSKVLLAMLTGPLAGWTPTGALVETALLVSAAAMLFRPDARSWFATKDTEEPVV